MCYLLWASFRWMLPHSITRPGTIIVNTDAHTQTGSHWLAIRLEPRSSSAFYFDSYGLSPNVLDIQTFLRRNCTVLNYNTVQLQGSTSTVCKQYCCLPCTRIEATPVSNSPDCSIPGTPIFMWNDSSRQNSDLYVGYLTEVNAAPVGI